MGLTVDVWGFDLKEGLPTPVDYRDMPYVWKSGFYKMDEQKLSRHLRRARLIIGDVKETVPIFVGSLHVPLAFVAFDLDLYSSTLAALQVFDGKLSQYLPRVLCYFDNTIGGDEQYHCKDMGELLAISEFNQSRSDRKIRRIHGLHWKRVFPDPWNDGMHVCHFFSHPAYNEHIVVARGELPLSP